MWPTQFAFICVMLYVKIVCKMFLSPLILCSTSSSRKLHTCANHLKYTRVQKFISCFTDNTVHVHCSQQSILLRENIGIYCENHMKQTSGFTVPNTDQAHNKHIWTIICNFSQVQVITPWWWILCDPKHVGVNFNVCLLDFYITRF